MTFKKEYVFAALQQLDLMTSIHPRFEVILDCGSYNDPNARKE